MEAPSDLLPDLRKRLRMEPSGVSVPESLPVLFFGDALSAEVATIGLNPSKSEYLSRNNGLLSGRNQRFATLSSLRAATRPELSDRQADKAIAIMRSYYDPGKPVYGSYFRHLSNFLAGVGASYQERTATHLDLVQESTDPVWSGLRDHQRAALLDRDLPFLAWELEYLPNLKMVMCAGKTVSDHVRRLADVDVVNEGVVKRIRWWQGIGKIGARSLPFGGWNYPLDRPTGLGTTGEIELGRLLARSPQ